tara:strand:- start:38 stop:1075 length:1038 start_codon:yes stop_codon:yes gene_type:complete
MGFARGFIKGFVSQAIDTKVAEDQRLAEFNEKIANLYIDEKRPAFMENEKMLKERFTLLNQKDPSLAKYAVSKPDLLSSDIGFEALMKADQEYIDRVKQLNLSGINFETGAKERTMNFNEKWKPTTDNLIKNQFGKNTIDLTVPIPGGNMQPTESVDFTTIPTVPGLFDTGDGSGFAEKSQYRLRLNDTTQATFSNVGLDGQFYMKGDNLITQFDEASRNKGILTQELINNRFTPKIAQSAGYLNVATQVANEIKGLETATSKFKSDTDSLFQSNNYSSGSIGATNDKTYEQFVLANKRLLSAYGNGSIAYKRFIREKFEALNPSTQGYYEFFERFDKEVDTEEM